MGDEDFLAGVNAHLTRHRFGNATLADLVDALDAASPRDVRALGRGVAAAVGPRHHPGRARRRRAGAGPRRRPAAPVPRHGVRRRAGRGRPPGRRPRRRAGAGCRTGPAGSSCPTRTARRSPACCSTSAPGRRSTDGLGALEDDLARSVLWATAMDAVAAATSPSSATSTLVDRHLPAERHVSLITAVADATLGRGAVHAGARRRRGRGARAAWPPPAGPGSTPAATPVAFTRGLARDQPGRRRAAPLAGRRPHRPRRGPRPAAAVAGGAPARRARRPRRRRRSRRSAAATAPRTATSAPPPRWPPGPTAEAKAEAWARADRGRRRLQPAVRGVAAGLWPAEQAELVAPYLPALPRGRAAARPRAGRRSPQVGRRGVPARSTSTRRSSTWCASALGRRRPDRAPPARGRTRSMTGRSAVVAAAARPGAGRLLDRRPAGRRAAAARRARRSRPRRRPRPPASEPPTPHPTPRRPSRAPCRRRGSAPGRCRCGRTATARPSRRRPSWTRAGSRCPTRSPPLPGDGLRVGDRAGAGRGARPVHLGARLPGRRRRPGLRAADVLGLRRPAAHRRAAAQPPRSPTTWSGSSARLYEARFPFEELRITTRSELDAHPTGDGNGTGVLRLPADHRLDHDVQPARLRPGHRPRPVPEPLRQRAIWCCPSSRRPTSTATTSGPG